MVRCAKCRGRGWIYMDEIGAVPCPACKGARSKAAVESSINHPSPVTNETTPFERQSETSQAAAESMAPLTGKLRLRIHGYLAKAGRNGRTTEEIEDALDLRHQTASPRVRELWQLGRIGTEMKRRTSSGRMANVWKIAKYCSNPEATVATVERHTCPDCGLVF